MAVDPDRAVGRLQLNEKAYYFCSLNCAAAFAQHPQRYTGYSKRDVPSDVLAKVVIAQRTRGDRSSPGIAGGAWCEVAVDSGRHWCANGAHSPSCSEFSERLGYANRSPIKLSAGLAMRVDHSYERSHRLHHAPRGRDGWEAIRRLRATRSCARSRWARRPRHAVGCLRRGSRCSNSHADGKLSTMSEITYRRLVPADLERIGRSIEPNASTPCTCSTATGSTRGSAISARRRG